MVVHKFALTYKKFELPITQKFNARSKIRIYKYCVNGLSPSLLPGTYYYNQAGHKAKGIRLRAEN
jgi:hypothetical protein